MRLTDAFSIADLARMARHRLPSVVWDYVDGGAEDESTLRANRNAFEQISLHPSVLTGNAKRTQKVTLFGQEYDSPFLMGPTGLNGLLWPDGDLALARAASASGIGFVLSTGSNNSLEQVAQDGGGGQRWFQLYPWGDENFSAKLLDRARAARFVALIVTVDTLTAGKRERDLRNRFSHELRITPKVVLDGLMHPGWLTSVWLRKGMPRFENLAAFLPPGASTSVLAEFTRKQRNPAFSWADVARLKRQWNGPMLVKGVLNAKDALAAAEVGADGVVISNHGGRQLDGAPATISVLPSIADALGGKLTLLVDSGFRRGTDIVKALALGADAVLLGRATLYGLAAAGEAGARRAVHILQDEVDRTLALLGVCSPSDLGRAHVGRTLSGPTRMLSSSEIG